MNTDNKKNFASRIPVTLTRLELHCLFCIILSVIFCLGCSSCAGQNTNANSALKNLAVSEKTFLAITNGSSLDAVRSVTGLAARHEFTISEKKTNYVLITCYVCADNNIDDAESLDLLFRDNTLITIMRPVDFPELRETYPYEGTTATRAKPWNIEDTPRLVRKTINAPALTQTQMLDYLKPYSGDGMQKENIAETLMFAGVVVLSGPVGWSNMHKNMKQSRDDYATNEVFLRLYDGCRASLGMKAEEVDALYGKPLRVFSMKNGQTARIYGDNRELDNIQDWFKFSCVAVVFDAQGNVKAIYSDGFFCDDWKK